MLYKRKRKNTGANEHNTLGQQMRKLGQLLLKRGFFIFYACERVRNLSHLGIHTTSHNNCASAAKDYGRAHVAHVFAVSERDIVFCARKFKCLRNLRNRNGLSRERCFLNLEACTFEYAAISANRISCLKQNHIAYYELRRGAADDMSIANDLRLCLCHLLKGFERFFCFKLLHDA